MSRSILEDVHEIASGLHKAGLMSDERLREFDILCKRPPSAYTPAQIRRIREKTDSDRDVFAYCLNISEATVRRWETGRAKPGGAALRLLNLVERKGLGGLA